MVLPAPLRDEQHRQDDQGELAEQARVVAARRSCVRQKQASRPTRPTDSPLTSQPTSVGGQATRFTVEVRRRSRPVRRLRVGQEPGQDADHRLVDLLRARRPLARGTG